MRRSAGWVIAFVLVAGGGNAASAEGVQAKAEVVSSHPLLPGVANLVLSEDGRHFAYTSTKDGKLVVIRDGVEAGAWDAVKGLTLSGDGAHWAHWGEREGKLHLVHDGKATVVEGQPHFVDGRSLWFGPGGQHLVAHLGRGRQIVALVDGVAGAEDPVAFGVTVSPDGSRVGYSVQRDRKGVVVLDGKEQVTSYEQTGRLVFSPDGKRHAYVARRGKDAFAVVDGKEGAPYDDVAELLLSSERAAYVGKQKDGQYVVLVNGEAGAPYPLARDLVLAGTHVAYAARKAFRAADDQTWVVVRDGKEGPEEGGVRGGSLLLSPDGTRLAYVARRGKAWHVVVDGARHEDFDAVLGALRFSSDGEHLAYTARRAGKWHLVVDGKVGAPYEEFGQVTFAPDGLLVGAMALKGGKPLLLLTSPDAAVEVTDLPGGFGPFAFDGPRSLHLISGPKGTLQVFRVSLTGP